MSVLYQGMKGLGDNIYQRPFLKAADSRGEKIYLETPWPQLYKDLPNIIPIRKDFGLRTQNKNAAASGDFYNAVPIGVKKVIWHYEAGSKNVLASLEKNMPLRGHPLAMDLPDFGPPPVKTERPYIVVRPATVRSEWRADARNCDPKYIREASFELSKDYDIISVADLSGDQEWALAPMPVYHQAFHRGELGFEKLMALIQGASAVVGPVGWILPASIAANVPLLCIFGGQGAHNNPEKLTDPRLNLDKVCFAMPEHFCNCMYKQHDCDKTIDDFKGKLNGWRKRVGI